MDNIRRYIRALENQYEYANPWGALPISLCVSSVIRASYISVELVTNWESYNLINSTPLISKIVSQSASAN